MFKILGLLMCSCILLKSAEPTINTVSHFGSDTFRCVSDGVRYAQECTAVKSSLSDGLLSTADWIKDFAIRLRTEKQVRVHRDQYMTMESSRSYDPQGRLYERF